MFGESAKRTKVDPAVADVNTTAAKFLAPAKRAAATGSGEPKQQVGSVTTAAMEHTSRGEQRKTIRKHHQA